MLNCFVNNRADRAASACFAPPLPMLLPNCLFDSLSPTLRAPVSHAPQADAQLLLLQPGPDGAAAVAGGRLLLPAVPRCEHQLLCCLLLPQQHLGWFCPVSPACSRSVCQQEPCYCQHPCWQSFGRACPTGLQLSHAAVLSSPPFSNVSTGCCAVSVLWLRFVLLGPARLCESLSGGYSMHSGVLSRPVFRHGLGCFLFRIWLIVSHWAEMSVVADDSNALPASGQRRRIFVHDASSNHWPRSTMPPHCPALFQCLGFAA